MGTRALSGERPIEVAPVEPPPSPVVVLEPGELMPRHPSALRRPAAPPSAR
jgi:hypothetical protein